MFKIPEDVQIGGAIYDVVITDKIRDSQMPVGRTCATDGVIELSLTESADFMYQTFLHELIHALHYDMGYNGDPAIEDEHYVDGMANALYALLRNNPHIFDWFEDDEEDDEAADKEKEEVKTTVKVATKRAR